MRRVCVVTRIRGGGGNLTLAMGALLMTLLLPLPALAQASAPCGSAPCMQIGREDPDHGSGFASDADHFVYCPEGETVQVEVIARPAMISCTGCEHTARAVTWTVENATNYTVVSASTAMAFNQAEINATFLLGDAGDTITITCTVAAANIKGECEEDKYGNAVHSGNHGQASANCTIKLWRMDMQVGETNEDPEEDPIPIDPTAPGGGVYEAMFAKSITTSAILVGAAPANVPNWEWESVIDSPTIHATEIGATSWGGEMVASSEISLTAYVQNGCDSAHTETAVGEIEIRPTIRRPGWTTEVQVAASDVNWMSSNPDAFPEIDWSLQIDGTQASYGRLANARVPYDLNFNAAVVPIYADVAEYPSDHLDFSSKVTQIPNGPNKDLYYNSDPAIFEVRRKILSNHWIHPSAGHPTVPSLDNDGLLYDNWLQVVEVGFGEDCKCAIPSDHGGTGTGAWWRGNLWHEGRGSPDSPNKRLLGHLSRLEDRFAVGPRSLVDPVYRCDLQYSFDLEGLRAIDEGERADASDELHNTIIELHNYLVTNGWNSLNHNFSGDLWIWKVGPPPNIGWQSFSKIH